MKTLIIFIISIVSLSFATAQVKLTSIEHTNTKWLIPVAKRVIAGQSGKFFQQYMPLENLIDSVGIDISDNQDLSLAGQALTITDGTGVTLPVVGISAGTGISVTNASGVYTINSDITAGITSLGGQTGATQTFATGTTGTNFNIVSSGDVHTFNIPNASATNRGLVTTSAQTFAGAKTFSYLGGAPASGNSLIVADQNGRLENLYGSTVGHVPKWDGTAFTLQADISGGISSLGGQTGATQTFAVANTGTYPSWSSATNIHTYRMPAGSNGQVLKHNGTGWTAGTDTDTNTDAQNLSYTASTGALAISGGTGTTIPVATSSVRGLVPTPPNSTTQYLRGDATWSTIPSLPAGVSSNTLTYVSAAWTTSSFLKNNSSNTSTGTNKRVQINDDGSGETWGTGTVNTATKFLVNGRVQLNSTSSSSCTSLMGRDGNNEVGTITVGSGLTLSGGTLTGGVNNNYACIFREGTYTLSATTTPQVIDHSLFVANIIGGNTTTDRLTVASTGTYEISYTVGSANPVNIQSTSYVYKNNSTPIDRLRTHAFSANVQDATMSKTAIVDLTAGDYIDLRLSTSSSVSVVIYDPILTIKKLY